MESTGGVEGEVLGMVEIEVDPFESIIDNVVQDVVAAAVPPASPPPVQEAAETKFEPEPEPETEQPEESAPLLEERPKKKRGRPKKNRARSNDSTSSDDLPLKRKRSPTGSVSRSEDSQEATTKSRRSHRSTRTSSFFTKYETGSGSEDDKIPFKGAQLSDDEYTPDKEAGKRGRKKRNDSVPTNGTGIRNLLEDFDAIDTAHDMGLNTIKIESVSSIAEQQAYEFKMQQADAAAFFLTQVMKSTSTLGSFIQKKADDFIQEKLSSGFVTDSKKLQFCLEKSFRLLDLIKNNIKGVETELKQNYVDFVKQHKLEKHITQDKSTARFLSEYKITFPKNGTKSCPNLGNNSDSDCEIVAEIPSTPKKSLDILRRVEKNGISWKAQRGSISSSCSDGSTKIQIPGQSTIFLNRNIEVKKVQGAKPQFESFFWEDGRTLKPPDDKENSTNKYKVKKIEKTALILGWLDLAYRKVSKQFFHIVREFERQKRYESCSDLGESCSDDDESECGQENEIFCKYDEFNGTPKRLSLLCLDVINGAPQRQPKLTYKMLEEQYVKRIKALEKYYLFTDKLKCEHPNTLVNLCVDKINNILEMSSSDGLYQMPPTSLLKLCIEKINNALNQPAIETERTSNLSENIHQEKDNSPVTNYENIQKNLQNETVPIQDNKEKRTENIIVESKSSENDGSVVMHEVGCEPNKESQNSESTVNIITSNESDEIVPEVNEDDLTTNKQIIEHIIIKPDPDATDLLKTDNVEDIHINQKDYLIDQIDFGDRDYQDSDDIISDAEDPMLQVTHEVYLKEDKLGRRSKRALEDLLDSSSNDDALTKLNSNKKKKLVKRMKKKTPVKPQVETESPEKDIDGWTMYNHLKGDVKLGMDCRVNIRRLPWDNEEIEPVNEEIELVNEEIELVNEEIDHVKEQIGVQEDFEIDKLLDFSTLAPKTKSKLSTEDDVDNDEETRSSNPSNNNESNSARKINKEKSSNDGNKNLFDLIMSGTVDLLGSDCDMEDDSDEVFSGDELNFGAMNCKVVNSNSVNGDLEKAAVNKGSFASILGLQSTAEPAEDSLEDLVKKHKEKINQSAKSLLIISSSDSSEKEDERSGVERRVKKLKTKSKENPETNKSNNEKTPSKSDLQKISESRTIDKGVEKATPRSGLSELLASCEALLSDDDDNDNVEDVVPPDDHLSVPTPNKVHSKDTPCKRESILQDLLSTPAKTISANSTSKETPMESPKVTFESLVEKAKAKKIKDKKRRKKKMKILTESDEERKKFQKKRNRLVKNEAKKEKERAMDDDSTDDSSVLTLSSVSSDISDEDDIMTYQPSSQRPNANTEYFTPIIKREPGLERTPKTPRTKNRLAYQELIDRTSSDDDECISTPVNNTGNEESAPTTPKGRKRIRDMLADESLLKSTKMAAREEEERLLRVIERNVQLSEIISSISPSKEAAAPHQTLILDVDIQTKEPVLSVNPALVKIMKEHQIDGVKFMWDTCFESVQMLKNGALGGGCILAHCMGLGKSLQVVSLIHTLLSSDLPFRTVLICCPLSTVLNWADEFKKWLRKIDCAKAIKIYELSKFKKQYERSFHLEDWHRTGGVFIIGYEMFRLLTNLKEGPDSKSHVISKINATLLNPGPDIVVCDEGHLLKNDNTILAKVMYKIRTRRRIVLTGTPLQNNLKEYYCMVNFVKPHLLGSRKEYYNRFENPIHNGQHRDSSMEDINIMKKRSHVLHKMLEGCVQRKEATLLYKYLPRKREFVLLITLSDCQAKIYRHYLSKYAKGVTMKGTPLLKDYHTLQKVWTHPRTLHKFFIKSRENKLNKMREFKPKVKYEFKIDPDGVICLEDADDVAEETLASPDDTDWWMDYITQEGMESLECSPKFSVAFQLLDESIQVGDKMLIFSTSLFTLDAIEFFLKRNKDWVLGKHYYRLDGSVTLENRQKWCRNFNSERNKDVKLFLISTRAGGLGINMIAANRVIIMDVSWNPSHDIQSIFRVYRFGQKKDCYIYRLVAMGTMEEKIYERSVTKQAISLRVVDEQQIDRHYSTSELAELYTFNPIPAGTQPVPSIPSDNVLAAVLSTSVTTIGDTENAKVPSVWSLHEHDSLLRDLHDEQLDEDERVAAWLEYQTEREEQKKQTEKDRMRQAVPNNCIIPDKQLPPIMYPLGPRAKEPNYFEMIKQLISSQNGRTPNLLQHVRVTPQPQYEQPYRPEIVPQQVRSWINPQRADPCMPVRPNFRPMLPMNFGSYSTLPLDGNNMVSLPRSIEITAVPSTSQNATKSSQIQSTSYALPIEPEDSYENMFLNHLHQSVQDVKKNTLPIPVNRAKPIKKKTPAKRKRKTPKKKPTATTSSINNYFKRTLNFDESHISYLPPIVNGYNSSEAESIVPDREDIPMVIIDSD